MLQLGKAGTAGRLTGVAIALDGHPSKLSSASVDCLAIFQAHCISGNAACAVS